jgi:hypothetical protein
MQNEPRLRGTSRRLSDFNKFEPFDIVEDGAIRCRGAVFALKQ